ncbi:zinc ribbon domain-containing protein [Limosilactobacillus reuteri]|uniref:zinc ribbon domain-containing protein n=1 Tax=Limosilactobacillus reuteri TaxID=1598 RepID=UPI00080C9EB3|nr:zinc ribbon domain-containing protein [Limosilactobacillus reuteri]ANU51955.1 zinc ribbon domain-containing protein [Limosilactobacillus reuteri]OXE60315.1 zinc ribbon domain-containing protein [Limosilactobacillus reuteri]QQR14085.1 zinc ribbon domain-containing protein [Limosilactobacillus reuteri]
MKYCPNCGNKLKQEDKFCEKCGYSLTKDFKNKINKNNLKENIKKARNQIKNKLKSVDISWLKQGKHQQYTIGVVIVLIILILFAGHIHNNGGSIVAPKNVSFTKMNGTRVWLSTEKGKGKNAIVDYIDITKNGKFIQYQIFDNNITLGKVSKMSNSQLIKLGKEQDKKYFDESINEVRALRDGKGQIGLQNDLMGDKGLKNDLNEGAAIYYTGDDDGRIGQIISPSQYNENNFKFYSESDLIDQYYDGAQLIYSPDNSNYCLADDINSKLKECRYNALINNMKGVNYLAPKWQKIKVQNTTDDSGNEVVSQKITYNSIDEFNDADTIDKNVMKLSQNQRQQIKSLYNDNKDATTIDGSLPRKEYSSALKKAENVFDESYYKTITKDIFKPQTFKDDMTLSNPTSQTIYNQKYVGYQIGDDNYLLTKAQNNKQKAVFAKPSN